VRLGLAELLDVPVRYLSTGQRKRAAFARLLGQQAGIWLLDEPLNGLDARAGGLVQKLAAEHCEAGGICVIASHQSFALPGMARLELGHYAPPLQGRSSETWQAEGEPSRSGVGRLPQSQREMDSPHPNRFREGEGLS
jgi:ABC-type transport system involved in cytochrome bd biosynthesis fused ATPase/permease subunit